MRERLPEELKQHSEWTEYRPDRSSDGSTRTLGASFNMWHRPVLAVPVIDTVQEETPNYEGRTFAFGGVVVCSHLAPAERAGNAVLRPDLTVVEVGRYRDGDWNLIRRLRSNGDTHVLIKGELHDYQSHEGSKTGVLQRLVRERGIGEMLTHLQYPELPVLAAECGVRYRESVEVYETLGTKSGLNTALATFAEKYPDASFGAFGVNFRNIEECKQEILRLRQYGVGAFIKLDRDKWGCVNAGGEGQTMIDTETDWELVESELDVLTSGNNQAEGVVQVAVLEHFVMSISSGEEESGYTIYEAHLQSQAGTRADGAGPLLDNPYSHHLINTVWPWYELFLRENGVKGRQNMNFLVMPPRIHKLAKFLYGKYNIGPIALIDLNYRGITGTMNVLGKFYEETGHDVDLANFRSRGVKVDRFFAANPHFVWTEAAEVGLLSGTDGNFSMINMGTFRPPFEKGAYKTQMVASGTIEPPACLLDRLEGRLSDAPSSSYLDRCKAVWGITPIQPPRGDDLESELIYTHALTSQMNAVKQKISGGR